MCNWTGPLACLSLFSVLSWIRVSCFNPETSVYQSWEVSIVSRQKKCFKICTETTIRILNMFVIQIPTVFRNLTICNWQYPTRYLNVNFLCTIASKFLSKCKFNCDGSDGRAAASYPADSGSNPAVSGSYEIVMTLQISYHKRCFTEFLMPLYIMLFRQWVISMSVSGALAGGFTALGLAYYSYWMLQRG